MRDRDPKAIMSPEFKNVLLSFKRLQSYVDKGSPGRNWNDATALLINGRAGVQVMGDWAKGEFALAKQEAGRDYGCIAGFGPNSPYIIQGDVLVFPKTNNAEAIKAQKLLATVATTTGHPGRLQHQEGLDPGAQRCRCQPARCLRPAGRGHHEGQVAPPGQWRGLPDAGSERCHAGHHHRLLEPQHPRSRRSRKT